MKRASAKFLRLAGRVLRVSRESLPDIISVWFLRRDRRFTLGDVPAAVKAPKANTRLYVAPANYAAQGFALARAAEKLPDVRAVSMQPRASKGYGFPVDYAVPQHVFAASGSWARRQRKAVAQGFTHVIVEAEKPLFGVACGGVVEREIRWLADRGLAVALFSHGTDLRLPSEHARYDDWSPFRQPGLDPEWVRRLEQTALHNRDLGERLGVPLFVATPELLLNWPTAKWLPNVVDVSKWKADDDILATDVPVVLHAPTNPLVKGTALIEPALERLTAKGIIDYQRVKNIPSGEMPARYRAADIVLDQFSLGIYSTTSIEAMAAGRLVIAHLNEQVRKHVVSVTGLEPPIVEATPNTLESVIRDAISDPEKYRKVARRGPDFVAAVHDGTFSAQVLATFLGTHTTQNGARA